MQTQLKNVVQIKKFSKNYKITICKSIIKGTQDKPKAIKKRGTANKEKLANNISRAKNRVMEYALCNEWDYFITLTLNPQKYKRDDLKTYIKDLGQFIRDYRKKHHTSVDYLLIPELHQDGKNWHMHGLIKGIKDFESHPVKPLALKGYLNWISYGKKFGFNSIGKIKDPVRVSMYIRKYITKDLGKSVSTLNHKMYYNSRGLKKAEKISEGQLFEPLNFKMDFEGQFTSAQFVNDWEWFKPYYWERR